MMAAIDGGVEVKAVWVVVAAKPQQERRAKRELENQGFEVYLPMRLFQNKRLETIALPFFPRYLFCKVVLDARVVRWKAIYSTLGVAGVLGPPECPIGVKDLVIEEIRAHEEAGFVKMAEEIKGPKFELGGRYRDDRTGIEGLFVERVDDKRAILLTRLFGDSRMTVDIRRLKLLPST